MTINTVIPADNTTPPIIYPEKIAVTKEFIEMNIIPTLVWAIGL
jgi:hypothetical protein